MDTAAGSLRIQPEISAAKYLLLHGEGGKSRPGLIRVSTQGPRVMSRGALIKSEYPEVPRFDNYLVFDVEPASEYESFEWDYQKLQSRQKNRKSAWPYWITLSELLSARL